MTQRLTYAHYARPNLESLAPSETANSDVQRFDFGFDEIDASAVVCSHCRGIALHSASNFLQAASRTFTSITCPRCRRTDPA